MPNEKSKLITTLKFAEILDRFRGELEKSYIEAYEGYCSTLQQCREISIEYSGIPALSNSHYFASILFTKICTTGSSIQNISPHPTRMEASHWDFGSLGTLTRSLLETYLTFYYLCIDKCSEEEADARLSLMNIHDHFSRDKMFKMEGLKYDSENEFTKISNELTETLVKNKWFKDQNFTAKKTKHFLSGKTAFFKTQDAIITSSGEYSNTFRFWYIFLSNNAHSFPMGFYRIGEDGRGQGLMSEIEVRYSSMLLALCEEYLFKASEYYINTY